MHTSFFHLVISVHNQLVLCKIFKICSWSSCVRPYERWNSYVSFAEISLLLRIVCSVIFALCIFFYVQKMVPSQSSFNAVPCIYANMCTVKTKYIKNYANSVRCLFDEKSISNTVTVEWCQMKYVYSNSQCCKLMFSRIHTIPSVPIVDCFQKIRQQVKCYLQMAGTMGKNELQEVSVKYCK